MDSELNIGFIGAGAMAKALAGSFTRAGLVSSKNLMASDPFDRAREAFAKAVGAKTTASNAEVVASSKVLLLAVKPNQVSNALADVRNLITPDHLVISIAAGVQIAKLEAQLPAGTRLVRAMPNAPALVGAGMSAFSLNQAASPQDAELAQKLFSAVGQALQVNELLLDAVTGLSGSGPAYVFMFIEALSDGGVAAGLPRDAATRLAAQTVMGAAKMLLETGLHPGALKDMVSSPAGTTIEGIFELEKSAFRGSVMRAVIAGAEKSRKLGQSGGT
jgi:pyrroline-5-carboxylate reductase